MLTDVYGQHFHGTASVKDKTLKGFNFHKFHKCKVRNLKKFKLSVTDTVMYLIMHYLV